MKNINLLLLVDSDEADALVTKRRIQCADLPIGRMVITDNLKDAKQHLTEDVVDMVLLELHLVDSPMLESLQEIRKCYDGVVMVLTNVEDEDVAVRALELGAEDYLVKTHLTTKALRNAVAFAQVRSTARQAASNIAAKLNRLDEHIALMGKE